MIDFDLRAVPLLSGLPEADLEEAIEVIQDSSRYSQVLERGPS